MDFQPYLYANVTQVINYGYLKFNFITTIFRNLFKESFLPFRKNKPPLITEMYLHNSLNI